MIQSSLLYMAWHLDANINDHIQQPIDCKMATIILFLIGQVKQICFT